MPYLRTGLLVTTMLLCSVPALGGLFEDLYRGLEIYTTPAGSRTGARNGRLVIRPNEFGEGYRLEVDRSFGADNTGRPEVFDFGNYELQLSGSTQATFAFTSEGILTGNADIFANNLNYALRAKSGGQDIALAGTLNVSQQLEVNRLGFYTLQLQISNTNSNLVGDGSLALGTLDADFDVGPISLRGNVFFDAALALLTVVGVDTDQLEGVFPMSPIDRVNDEIEAALGRQSEVLGEIIAADLENSGLEFGEVLDAAEFAAELDPALDLPLADGSDPSGGLIPEPASVLLIGLLGLIGLQRRA